MSKPNVFAGLVGKAARDLDEACGLYGFDINVEKRPLYFYGGEEGETRLTSPYHCQIVNADNDRAMGVVGLRYTVVPYRRAFSPAEALLAGGARIVNGGCPNRGERAYLVLEADGVIKLSAKDHIVNRFMLTSSHDGTGKVEVRMTPYRAYNGTALTFDASRPLAFKHTLRVADRINKARKVFSRVNTAWFEFSTGVQKMVAHPLKASDARAFIENVMPGDTTRTENIRGDIYTLYSTTGIGTRMPKCRGTLFGLVQAFAEWADHKRTVRKSSRRDAVAANLDAHLVADSAKKKQKAWAMALYLANNKKMSGASVGNRK